MLYNLFFYRFGLFILRLARFKEYCYGKATAVAYYDIITSFQVLVGLGLKLILYLRVVSFLWI